MLVDRKATEVIPEGTIAHSIDTSVKTSSKSRLLLTTRRIFKTSQHTIHDDLSIHPFTPIE